MTDEELEKLKPVFMAFIPILYEPSMEDTNGRCLCAYPPQPCGNRWECQKRPDLWKREIRRRYNL